MNYIGVDGGGTRTDFDLYDKYEEKIDNISLGTCHYRQVGYDGMANILKKGVNILLSRNSIENKDIKIGFAIAGYGREKNVRDSIEKSIEKTFMNMDFTIINDVEAAHMGALNGNEGIVVIAGTGSIAYSNLNGIVKRTGGWGSSIGDEGSAFWLGKKALEIFSKESDGRLKKSFLYEIMMKELGLKNDFSIISYVNEILLNKRENIADLAKFIYMASLKGDINTIKAYEEAAFELSLMVRSILLGVDKVGKIDVSYIGGVFNSGNLILKPFENYLPKRVNLTSPKNSPSYGSYLYARNILE